MIMKFRQVRSAIGSTSIQKANLQALKLGRIGKESEFEQTSSVVGRFKVVKHLVEVEYVKAK